MTNYGNYGTTAPSTGTLTNMGRANVYPAATENGWAYDWFGLVSRTGATAAWARGHFGTVANPGVDNTPGPLLSATSEFSVTGLGSYGSDLELMVAALTTVSKITNGQKFWVGFAARGGEVMHGMVLGTSLPATYDKNMYARTSVGSTGPYNPWADTTIAATSHIRNGVTYEPNVRPDIPINRAPYGLLSTAPAAFVGAFRDSNETVGPSNRANPGEQLNQYKIQLRVKSTGVLQWDTTYTASAGEKTARAFSKAYSGSGSLSAGIAYEWRCQVSDAFGEFSDWSTWLEFQIGSAGTASVQASPGVSGRITTQTPTGFAVSYSHPTALSTSQVQLQILEAGVVIRDVTIASVQASGASFTINPTWGGGGLVALPWSKTLTWQWRAYDSTAAPTAYSAPVNFNTNYQPSTPSNLSPSGGAVSLGYPKLTFTCSDLDNTVATGFYTEIRIKNSGGTLLQTRNGALKAGTSNVWEYQTTAADFTTSATYKWDARGRDGSLDGNYSTESTFYYAEAPVITSPANDDYVTASGITVSYSITGQTERRISLINSVNGDTVATTGWVTAALTGSAVVEFDVSNVVTNGQVVDLLVETELSSSVVTSTRVTNLKIILDPTHTVTLDPTLSAAIAIGSETKTSAIRLVRDDLVGIDSGNFSSWRIKEGPATWASEWDDIPAILPDFGMNAPYQNSIGIELPTGSGTLTGGGTIRYVEGQVPNPYGPKTINYCKAPRGTLAYTGSTAITTAVPLVLPDGNTITTALRRTGSGTSADWFQVTGDERVSGATGAMSAYVRAGNSLAIGQQIQVGGYQVSAPAGYRSGTANGVNLTEEWQRVSLENIVWSPVATERMIIKAASGYYPVGALIEVTAIQIENVAVATPYVDGTSPDTTTEWTGTVNASPSKRRGHVRRAVMLEEVLTNYSINPYASGVTAFGYAPTAGVTRTWITGANMLHPDEPLIQTAARFTWTTTDNTGQNIASRTTTTVAADWVSASFLVRGSGVSIGKTFRISIYESGVGTPTRATADMVLTGEPQLMTVSGSLLGGGISVTSLGYFVSGSASGDVVDITAAQLEWRTARSTLVPMLDSAGALLTGYTWAGTAHGSESTRAAGTTRVLVILNCI